MKPYPLAALNHFTTPFSFICYFFLPELFALLITAALLADKALPSVPQNCGHCSAVNRPQDVQTPFEHNTSCPVRHYKRAFSGQPETKDRAGSQPRWSYEEGY